VPKFKGTLKERLLAKVRIDPITGCWIWIASRKPEGYGQFMMQDEEGRWHCVQAHRISYELFKGPIPDGLTLDHMCHDPPLCPGGNECPHRPCINPNHLEPASHQQNIARGGSPAAKANRFGVCRNGHPRTAENTLVLKGGGKTCKICHAISWEKTRAQRNQQARDRYWESAESIEQERAKRRKWHQKHSAERAAYQKKYRAIHGRKKKSPPHHGAPGEA
jgi:HNH endonuclease